MPGYRGRRGGPGGGAVAAGGTTPAPPWHQSGQPQNRGWAAGMSKYLPGDSHARRQAPGMPGSPCGRGVRWRWRRRRRHRTGTTLAQLGPTPKPRLGCGNGSVPPKGHSCRDPGRGHAWCSCERRARWGRGGAAAGGCAPPLAPLKSNPKPRLGLGKG